MRGETDRQVGRQGSNGTDGTRHERSAAGSVLAQQVEVSVPRRVPPAARLHPLLTVFVSEGEASIAQTPPLQALFALLDQVGAAEVHRRTLVHTSWYLVEAERPRVALRLEISEPPDARGVVEVVIDAADYQRAWESTRGGRWVGITSRRRLHPHADGSAPEIDEAFAACIPVDADPPPKLATMAHVAN
jgi:hypothetical protein